MPTFMMDRKNDRVFEYCKIFEEILKCPVCGKKLVGDVYMCGSGHSICNDCQNSGTQCTKCHTPYTKMKNLLVQELLLKFDGMKMGLRESDDSKMQSKQDKVSVGVDNPLLAKGKLAPNKFRCWVVKDCEYTGCLADVIGHFKKVHPLEFEEDSNGRLPYKQNWQMSLFAGNILNRVFKISDYGVFVLSILRNDNAELSACILMYTRDLIARQYSYKIEIECNDKKLSYNGQVESARTPKHIIMESGHKCLVIDRNEPLFNELQEKSRFKCSIIIKKDELIDAPANTNCNKNNDNIDKKKKDNDQQSSCGQKKDTDRNNQSLPKKVSKDKNTRPKKSGIEKKNGQQKKVTTSIKQSIQTNTFPCKAENTIQRQHKANLVTDEHLANLKSSVEADLAKSMTRYQSQLSPNNMGNFTNSSGTIHHAPFIHQPSYPHSTQLYPNLMGSGYAQGANINYVQPVKHEMIYQCNANTHQSHGLGDSFKVPPIPTAPSYCAGPHPSYSDSERRTETPTDVCGDKKDINKCPMS